MEKERQDLRSRTVRGAVWSIAMRWSIRLIGLVSMVILARLLTPDDYGIMAMAMIVTGFSAAMFELGVNVYLIQKADADDEDFNTGWTLRIIQGVFAATLIISLTPIAQNYFRENQIVEVLLWLAIIPFIQAAENIGTVKFQKELDMQRDFTFFVTKKAIGFAVTICAAYLLRNFWAFVIGGLASAFGALFLSYAMHPYRPRLSLSRLKPMLSISVWLLIRNIGIYAQSRMDQILLAGRLSASDLGIYRMGTELASMPTSEILAPLGRVLLPAFSKITTDLGRLRAAFYKSLGTIAIVGIPAAVGLALVAEPFVYVVLGEKWLGVVDSLRILAMVELIMTLRYVAATVLFSMGQVRLITALTWLEVVVFVVVCTGGWFELTLVNVALTRVAASSVSTLLVLVRIVGTGVARTGELFVVLARPVVASLVMVAAVLIVQRLEIPSHILALLLQTAVGAASFSLSLVLIWLVSGRPESAERFILETAGLQLRKLLR